MCFSAEASFGASAVLGVAVRNGSSKDQMLLASIPFLFSAQQFAEGMVWLGQTNALFAGWQQAAAYTFLVFALVVWPVWIVLSVLLVEQVRWRRKVLRALLLLGLLVAGIAGYGLFYFPVEVEVLHHHIHYKLAFKQMLTGSSNILYFIPTIVPDFISGLPRMWLLGLALLVVYLIAQLYFAYSIVSVWCFLAAAVSVVVIYILRNQKAAVVA